MDDPAYVGDEKSNGIWIVYGRDTMAYPLFVSKEEINALRFANELGYYAWVTFWQFDTEWEDDHPIDMFKEMKQ